MKLVLEATSPPPEKKYWHDPDPSSRGEWSSIFEIITNWFCTSHDFNHDHDLLIRYNDLIIELMGDRIRYLAPSLRSAASLVYKAYKLGSGLSLGERMESTPGINVARQLDLNPLPRPYYVIVPCTEQPSDYPISGTLFTYNHEDALEYRAPASRLSQAIVWAVQRGIQ